MLESDKVFNKATSRLVVGFSVLQSTHLDWVKGVDGNELCRVLGQVCPSPLNFSYPPNYEPRGLRV